LIEQSQSPTFLLALRLIFVLLPVILLGLALLFALRFPLTPLLHQQLNAHLSRQRAGLPVDEREKEFLVKTLLG